MSKFDVQTYSYMKKDSELQIEYKNIQEIADYGNGLFLKLRDYDDIRLNENYTEIIGK